MSSAKMKRIKYGLLIASISWLLISCDTLIGFMGAIFSQGEKPFENKIYYHAEEIFYIEDLGYENLMFCTKSIDYDDEYIYCITGDDDYFNTGHGVLIVTDREGKNIRSLVVCDEARKAGYDECYAYELESVDVYDDVIIVSGQERLMFPRYTELVCLDKKTLAVLWHWHSEDEGWNFYSATSQWNDKFVFYHDCNSTTIVTVLDRQGREIISRKVSDGKVLDSGNLFVKNDRLYMRTTESPYTVFNLNLLIDPSKTVSECIEFSEDEGGEADIFTSLISDGKNAYFPAIYKNENDELRTSITSYDVSENKFRWRTELNGTFDEVSGIITQHKGRLYVPADYGSVYCLDAETGKQLWHTDIRAKDDELYDVNLMENSCVVSDRWLCIPCNSNQQLLVLDINNGEIMARIKGILTPTTIQCFSEGDYLYLAASHGLYRFIFWEK